MSKENIEEVTLKVVEAKQRDVGRKIARIDSDIMRKLDLVPGDVIEIIGKKSTTAIVWPAYKEDEKAGIIRIDGETRRNAGVTVGDVVQIRKAKAKPAKKVVLAPFEQLPFIGDIGRIVLVQLMNQPVSKGDVLVVPILGVGLELKVISTNPEDVDGVIITEDTLIDIIQPSDSSKSEKDSKKVMSTANSLSEVSFSENDLIELFINSGIIQGSFEREVKVGSSIWSIEGKVLDWRKIIDLVCYTTNCVWIIEAKKELNFEAIGQVIVYSTLYAENDPTKVIKKGIICYATDEDLIRVCRKNGITVFKIQRDGTVKRYD